jgi:hypothetical protein
MARLYTPSSCSGKGGWKATSADDSRLHTTLPRLVSSAVYAHVAQRQSSDDDYEVRSKQAHLYSFAPSRSSHGHAFC